MIVIAGAGSPRSFCQASDPAFNRLPFFYQQKIYLVLLINHRLKLTSGDESQTIAISASFGC